MESMDTNLNELELRVLFEISQTMGQALNLHQALVSVLETLAGVLATRRAAIILKDADTGHLVTAASYGLAPPEPQRGEYCLDEDSAGQILRAAHPFVLTEGGQEPLSLEQIASRRLDKRSVSLMGTPIFLGDAPVGVLGVDRLFPAEVSLKEDFRFLGTVASLVAQIVNLNLQVRAREESWQRENLSLKAELSEKSQNLLIVGQSPAILEVQQAVKRAAPSRAPVLLLGESGTGKTLIGRVIHELSPRARYPFLKINCSSLPEHLLESELFGFEKDAFPGASKARPGRLEEADGGSVFLEEVEALSPALQARLLKFLQTREFERLSGTRTRKVDVRILAATTVELTEAVAAGSFPEDLYYLLKAFPIRVPPLRERRQDIPLLLNHFLDKVSEEYGRRFYFTRQTLEALTEYNWPGNVREMENLVERVCLMVEGSEIDLKDLPSYLTPAGKKAEPEDQSFLSRLKEMEKREIMAALERNHWIQSQAAVELGLTLRQIGYRVKQFGLEKLIKEQRAQGRSG
jgi:Nif-specific regulatory protein